MSTDACRVRENLWSGGVDGHAASILLPFVRIPLQQLATFSFPVLILKMKLALAPCFLAGLSVSSAFVLQHPSVGSLARTELSASRAAAKTASRTKWVEARGFIGNAEAAETNTVAAGLMKNDMGLEYVKLSNGSSSSEIYLYGGVVTSYKDAAGTEFIAVRPDAKMDGSKPISGGLSHCWPQVRHFGARPARQDYFARISS